MKTKYLLLVLLGLTSEYYRTAAVHVPDAASGSGNTQPGKADRSKRDGGEQDDTPKCGKPLYEIGFAAGGSGVLIELNPWHAGLYKLSPSGILEQACGGTLISKTIVITAAHCFFNENHKRFNDIRLYKIGLGKQYRSWTDEESNAQTRDIEALHVPRRYRGVRGQFASDIALVVLSSAVEITSTVNIICVDWSNEFEKEQFSEGQFKYGLAVGWGKLLNGTSSDILQGVYLPYVPFDTCYDALTDNAKDIYTPDKFCAGHQDKNTSVCQGDSGGGLVFPHCDRRSYLRGIVSVSFKPAHNNDPCFAQLFTGFTRISAHLDWIKEHVDMEYVRKASNPSPICKSNSKTLSETTHTCLTPKSGQMCTKFASSVESSQDSACATATQYSPRKRQLSRPKEFPHMAAIGMGDVTRANITWNCDGSLISERYVLTAAHCFQTEKRGMLYWVRLGDWNTSHSSRDVTARQQLIEVVERIPHYRYTHSTLYHDIALVKLKEAVVINAYVRPACLDWQPPGRSTGYTVSGFGKESFGSERREQLMKGQVTLRDYVACNGTYSEVRNLKKLPAGIDHNTMMCFLPEDIQTDCVAVGGAPVQKILDNLPCMYSIVGVTAFGSYRCGTTDKPFVATRVYFYRTWIENILWPELDFSLATQTN